MATSQMVKVPLLYYGSMSERTQVKTYPRQNVLN